MEFSSFHKETLNRCKRKVIPWHVQKRYMENLSQLSVNQTISTAFYKKKIKSLQKNNKELAVALQRSRHLATEKENLLVDNGKILDFINFSKLKLMDMAKYMKQATACLDETLVILNSSVTDCLSKRSPKILNYRNHLKDQLQGIKIEPLKEVAELESDNPDISVKSAKHNNQKGKIFHVDGCVFSPTKKCRLGMKGGKLKRSSKDMLKSEQSSSTNSNLSMSKNSTELKREKLKRSNKDMLKSMEEPLSTNSNLLTSGNSTQNNSKECASKLNIESQSRKKLPKSTSIKSASSFKHFGGKSKFSTKAKNKHESLNKKRKTVKDILTDTVEAFITNETEFYSSPQTNRCTSVKSKTGSKCSTQKSAGEDILIEKDITSEIINKQISTSNSSNSQFASKLINCERTDYSQNTSDPSYLKNLSSFLGDVTTVNNKFSVLPSEKNKDCTFDQTSVVEKIQQIQEGGNFAKQKNEKCMKNNDSKKVKISCDSSNSKVKKRMQFYFDEDSIEKVDGRKTVSKSKKLKSPKKYKGKKTVVSMNKNNPSMYPTVKSNIKLPDNVSKLGKNSFLVTAEVHSPPVSVYAQEVKRKMCTVEKMEPRVVLTDIFESNQTLLSEMVNSGLRGNGYSQKITINSTEVPLVPASVNNLKIIHLDIENNAENRCLPEDREIIEKRHHRHRAKIVSYKEPPLNVKMRRLI